MPAGRVGPLTRARRRELTRTALIESAAELFAGSGFHATSLEEIAHAAGFTRGAIYKNFKSKEDILMAVVEWQQELQLAAYADALEDAKVDSSERVSVAADVWARAFRRDRSLTLLELELRLHAMRNPVFGKQFAAWDRQQRERIAWFIAEQAHAAGLRLTVEPEDIAALSLAGVEGLSLAASIHTSDSERYDGLVALFFRMVSEGMVSEPVPTPKAKANKAAKKKR